MVYKDVQTGSSIVIFLKDGNLLGHKSSYIPIKTGVPQGSVLGPLLFLNYINDLPLVSNVFDMLMYADDTTLYCNINQNIGEELINAELTKLWEWLGANKLSLNIAKTKYMVFNTSKRNVIYPNLNLIIIILKGLLGCYITFSYDEE